MIAALDIRTLSLSAAVISWILCCYLLNFQATRRTYPGFKLWTLGSLSLGAGLVLLALRGLIPVFISVITANALIILEIVLIRRGLAAFMGQPARVWPDAAFLALYASLLVWFTYFQPDITARVMVISLGFACYLAWSTWLAAEPVAELLGSRNWLLIASLAGLSAFHALRAVLTLLGTPIPENLLSPNYIVSLTMLVSLAGHILVINGLVILNVQRLEKELNAAQGEVNMLSGLLPICSGCKRIRDEAGGWQPVEAYISRRSEAKFTHGICPDCLRERYPEVADQVLNK
jgi:hypothetical protein